MIDNLLEELILEVESRTTYADAQNNSWISGNEEEAMSYNQAWLEADARIKEIASQIKELVNG